MVRQALLCSYNELHPIKTKKIKLYTNIPIVPSFRDYFFLVQRWRIISRYTIA